MLELGVPRRPDLHQRIVAPIVHVEARDRLRVAAIQAFRETKDGREAAHDPLLLARERLKPFVPELRLRAAVITRDERRIPRPYAAARWISRASSVPGITRGRMPVCSAMDCRNSQFSASRTALVATATVSSTPRESASRLNLDMTCRAVCLASGVRARPSRPPAPGRTISFSRSTTSNDESGRIRTTIMWSEFFRYR